MSDNNNTSTAAGGNTSTVDTGTPTPQDAGRTFTQDEVNRIVQERLAKERSKQNPPPLSEKELDLAEREKELARREFAIGAKEALTAKGLPETLMDALNTSSKEAFENSLSIVENLIKEREDTARAHRPPAYAAGTGSNPMYCNNEGDAVRKAMGLK